LRKAYAVPNFRRIIDQDVPEITKWRADNNVPPFSAP
jgi:hypothetical protein